VGALGDLQVVRDEVSLRISLVGPEHFVQVGQAELTAVDLEPPRVTVATRVDLVRELDRERRARAAFRGCHQPMVAAADDRGPGGGSRGGHPRTYAPGVHATAPGRPSVDPETLRAERLARLQRAMLEHGSEVLLLF